MATKSIHQRDLIAGLQKGLALMQCFSEQRPRLNAAEAARVSGLTQSAARRFLLTLVHDGFAETDGRNYWLTARTLRISQAYVDSAQLPRMLRPIVEQVARVTGEHVSVAVKDDDQIVHIMRSRYSHISSLSIREGSRVPMYCTASGRIWLAAMSKEALEKYLTSVELKPLTPFTKTSAAKIRAEVDRTKAAGYAELDQEYEVGMRVLAVPLTNRQEQMRASLSVTTHASRFTLDKMRDEFLVALYEGQALLKPVIM